MLFKLKHFWLWFTSVHDTTQKTRTEIKHRSENWIIELLDERELFKVWMGSVIVKIHPSKLKMCLIRRANRWRCSHDEKNRFTGAAFLDDVTRKVFPSIAPSMNTFFADCLASRSLKTFHLQERIEQETDLHQSLHKIFNLILWSTAHQTERTYPVLRERSMDGTIKLEKEEIPRSIQGHFMNFRRKLFHSHFAFIRNIFRLKWMERNKIARRNEKFIWNDFSHRHELKFSSSQDERKRNPMSNVKSTQMWILSCILWPRLLSCVISRMFYISNVTVRGRAQWRRHD